MDGTARTYLELTLGKLERDLEINLAYLREKSRLRQEQEEMDRRREAARRERRLNNRLRRFFKKFLKATLHAKK